MTLCLQRPQDFINLVLVRDEYRRNPQEEIRKLRWQDDDFKPYVHIIQGITELCKEHGEPVFDYCRETLAITFFLTRKT